MKMKDIIHRLIGSVVILWLSTMALPVMLNAHCDTMNGPVVKDAQIALEKNNSAIALKWIKKEYEQEVQLLFVKTVKVRSISSEMKELADRLFFETLVRLHRAGEGMPYTGLKETEVEHVVQEADRAIVLGDGAELSKTTLKNLEHLVHQRFETVMETKATMNKSIDAGRAYVDAYVQYIHLIEQINALGSVHHKETNREENIHIH